MSFTSRLSIGLLLLSQFAFSQTPADWQTLSKVDFISIQDPIEGYTSTKPIFDPSVAALADQFIQISGYVLPADTEGKQYVLSAFPYASCFFCGGAGRESVIMLELRPGHRRFAQDEYLPFSGILRLSKDEYELIYHLEEARLVK